MQSIKPIPLYIQLNGEVIVVISRMDGMDLDQIQMLSLKDLQGFHQSARFMRHFEYDEDPVLLSDRDLMLFGSDQKECCNGFLILERFIEYVQAVLSGG